MKSEAQYNLEMKGASGSEFHDIFVAYLLAYPQRIGLSGFMLCDRCKSPMTYRYSTVKGAKSVKYSGCHVCGKQYITHLDNDNIINQCTLPDMFTKTVDLELFKKEKK